jgi:hypothetical protein
VSSITIHSPDPEIHLGAQVDAVVPDFRRHTGAIPDVGTRHLGGKDMGNTDPFGMGHPMG